VIIVIARMEVDPEALPRLHPLLEAIMRATWDESGCLSYSMAIEDAAGGVISLVERWADEAALAEHFKMPHMVSFEHSVKAHIRSLDARVYTVTGERQLTV